MRRRGEYKEEKEQKEKRGEKSRSKEVKNRREEIKTGRIEKKGTIRGEEIGKHRRLRGDIREKKVGDGEKRRRRIEELEDRERRRC